MSALIAVGPCAGDAAYVLRLPALGVQLRVPGAWRVLGVVEGQGVTLGEPGSDEPGLDVVVWEPVARNLSAKAAALAHEETLAAALPYTRESLDEFIATDGGRAALVTGAVRAASGGAQVCLFAAYSIGARYFVVGTFCDSADVARLRRAFFDEAVATFSPTGTLLPPARPGPPGATGEGPGAGHPGTPIVEPPGPAASEGPADVQPPPATPAQPRLPTDLTPRRSPLGFELRVPEEWSIRVEGGCVLAGAERGTGGFGVAIWPVRREVDAPIQKRARRAAERFAELVGARWRTRRTRLAAARDVCAVCAGEMSLAGAPVEALAVLTPAEGFDLLQVALFPADAPDQDRLVIAAILGSFDTPRLWTRASADAGEVLWLGDDGALEARAGGDWVVSGGVRTYNGMAAIRVEGREPSTGASFSWRQPELPFYKDLSPALTAAGWREGAEFPPDRGVDPLIISKRPSPTVACRTRATGEEALTIRSSGPANDIAALLPRGRGAFADAAGETGAASCLCAVADAPPDLGEDAWMVASLIHGGPPGAHRAAGVALRALILSATPAADSLSTEEDRAALTALLDGARLAAQHLPAPRTSTPPGSASSVLVSEGAPNATPIELPSDVAWLWKLASDSAGAAQYLPELLSEY